MKYFITEEERKTSGSTCYFEFMKGRYHDKCWLPDSISISDELWDEVGLSKLISGVIGCFDYYGVTVINKHQWGEIVKNSKGSDPIIEDVITSACTDRKVKDEGRNWKRQRDDAVICA